MAALWKGSTFATEPTAPWYGTVIAHCWIGSLDEYVHNLLYETYMMRSATVAIQALYICIRYIYVYGVYE